MTTSDAPRYQQLVAWLESLNQHNIQTNTLRNASSDASFRHYYRVNTGPDSTTEGSTTLVVMDAPPPHEDCRPFIDIGQRLREAGLNVPQVLAHDLNKGFLLLTDLGPTTYYAAIQQGLGNTAPKPEANALPPATADDSASLSDPQLQALYKDAINALIKMQQANTQGLPVYTLQWLIDELALFPQWYVGEHCKFTLSESETAMLAHTFSLLAADNMRQPFVLVHRDFHSPNLMLSDQQQYGPNPGVIDYQDALLGPISYDIASLVMDARTTWDESQQLDWAIRYWEAARAAGLPVPADFARFHRDYEWMSLQRNLRILGVFARLAYRDGKQRYLDHIPRVNAYIRQVASRYGQFSPLLRLFDRLDNIEVKTGLTF